jgi:hypothetical protein
MELKKTFDDFKTSNGYRKRMLDIVVDDENDVTLYRKRFHSDYSTQMQSPTNSATDMWMR